MPRPCDCIEKLEARFSESFKDPKIDREVLSGKTYSPVYHTDINGRGKEVRKTTNLFHNYCPFCGKRYQETEEVS